MLRRVPTTNLKMQKLFFSPATQRFRHTRRAIFKMGKRLMDHPVLDVSKLSRAGYRYPVLFAVRRPLLQRLAFHCDKDGGNRVHPPLLMRLYRDFE